MPENNNTPVTKADFEVGMKALRDYIDERTRDMQTELLRAFRSYQESTNVTLLT
jgi:hypothetical protein